MKWLTVVVLLSTSGLSAQDIQFYREDIHFRLTAKHICVEGYYFFCNTSAANGEFILFYPFPQDKNYGAVDSVELTSLPELKEIPCSFSSRGLTFNVKVDAYNTRKIRVKYRQKISGTVAEYILLTTHTWQRPLEMASYSLSASPEIQIDSLSYLPDTTWYTNKSQMYSWKRKNFLPDKNFRFYFHPRRRIQEQR